MKLERDGDVAILVMEAGKANAMGHAFFAALHAQLDALAASGARAAVITGYDRFFSAGLALPELIDLDREGMRRFITAFSDVMLRVFELPLPVVACINGHAVAGGCVLALQCDYRLMAEGDFQIGLNEIALGIGLPAIVVEPLRLQVPPPSWHLIAQHGELVTPKHAEILGLIDEASPAGDLRARSLLRARKLAALPGASYAQIKASLRRETARAVRDAQPADTEAWLDTWFDPEAQHRLRAAVARLRRK